MANDDIRNDDVNRSDEQIENRIDPEREIPDPEQVERDRKEAEKIYGDQKDRKAS
jgi:hypothetical protein